MISQLGVMSFDEKTKRMRLLSLHPGVTLEQIKSSTGFDLLMPDNVIVTDPPTSKELRILRKEIDPTGIALGRR